MQTKGRGVWGAARHYGRDSRAERVVEGVAHVKWNMCDKGFVDVMAHES